MHTAESETLTDWNEARSIAHELVTTTTTDTEVTDVASDWPHIEFPSPDQIHTALEVTQIAADRASTADTDQPDGTVLTDTIAKWLLAQELSVTPSKAPDPEAYYFENWNRTQQIATELLTNYRDEKDLQLEDVWPSTDTPSEQLIRHGIESVMEESDDQHDQRRNLAKWIKAYYAGEIDADAADATPPIPDDVDVDADTWQDALELGEILVTRFKDHETNRRYVDIKQEWSEFELPNRDEMLMTIMNLSGDDRDRFVQQAAEYIVSEEDDDEEDTPASVTAQRPYRGGSLGDRPA